MYEEIKKSSENAINELLEVAKVPKGQIVVIGCSSSEIMGVKIGKGSTPDVGKAVVEAVLPILNNKGLYLAAQCCEHLNRALVIERGAAIKFNFEIVSAVPKPKAGGSFATAAYKAFSDPVLVEHVKASAGLDIGCTMIGMHLKHVAVPLRLETKKIGEALVTSAKSRPKLIGGERAEYK